MFYSMSDIQKGLQKRLNLSCKERGKVEFPHQHTSLLNFNQSIESPTLNRRIQTINHGKAKRKY